MPALHGYLGVTIKEDAEAILVSEDDKPIYAVWYYGIGTESSTTVALALEVTGLEPVSSLSQRLLSALLLLLSHHF